MNLTCSETGVQTIIQVLLEDKSCVILSEFIERQILFGVGSLEFFRLCSRSSSSKHLNTQEPRNSLFYELFLKNMLLKSFMELIKYIRRLEEPMQFVKKL